MAVQTREKLSSRHLLVVLTGIMITFGCSALCFSTWGLFQPVVSEALGVPTTSFALYVTIMYLTMTVASPIAGKLLQKVDVRIILSASACSVAAAFALMGFSTNIYLFYVAGVLLGLGEISILWLAIPVLVNNWFYERAGFLHRPVHGLHRHRRGAVVHGCSPRSSPAVWTSIRSTSSGRSSRWSLRCRSRCSACAPRPSDCGLAPYGATVSEGKEAPKPQGPVRVARHEVVGVLTSCASARASSTSRTSSPCSSPRTRSRSRAWLSMCSWWGGIMSTVMMVGQALFKIILGAVVDKSVKGALWFAFAGWRGWASSYAGSASLRNSCCTAARSSSARSTPRR